MAAKKNNDAQVSNRIKALIEGLEMNTSSFSKAIGIGNNVTIGRIINESRKPSYDVLEKILQTFGNVNADWLMKGQGAMFKCGPSETSTPKVEKRKFELGKTSPNEGVPYYEIEVSASPLFMFSDESEVPSLRLMVPGFEDCDMALNVWGDSMHPTYCSGDIIICKRIIDKTEIVYGEPYLIITPERRLLKYIKKSKSIEKWLLVSENDFYDPIEIDIARVIHLYIVKGRVKRNSL